MRYPFILVLALLIASCTEEVIVPQIVEVPAPDTVYIDRHHYDTITNTIILRDTVTQDSIITIIEHKLVYVHDTVYQWKTDTLYIHITEYRVEPEYIGYVELFYAEAKAYGWGDLPKVNLIVTYWYPFDPNNSDPAPTGYYGDGITYSKRVEDVQWVVKVNAMVRHDRLLVAIYRELAHALLNKPYAALDADEIMNPAFPKVFAGREYEEPELRPYLDKLFIKL